MGAGWVEENWVARRVVSAEGYGWEDELLGKSTVVVLVNMIDLFRRLTMVTVVEGCVFDHANGSTLRSSWPRT